MPNVAGCLHQCPHDCYAGQRPAGQEKRGFLAEGWQSAMHCLHALLRLESHFLIGHFGALTVWPRCAPPRMERGSWARDPGPACATAWRTMALNRESRMAITALR